MSGPDLVLRGRRVVRGGSVGPAAVHVRDGRVDAVTAFDETAGAARVIDSGELTVMSALVDAHVHANDPGRTEWEGYATATAAAAAGGITTIVDMPLNGLPPLLDAAAGSRRVEALTGVARADVALWGGLVSAECAGLAALAAFGVAGAKCFLSPSGVPEFPNVGERELDAAMPVLRDLGLPLLAHAESPAALDRAAAAAAGSDPLAYGTWLASRPAEAEAEAIDLLVRLCRRHLCAVHLVHVSSGAGVERIAAAKAEGLPVTAETCPHYLAFSAEDVPDGATAFKCAPPVRSGGEREALWRGLEAGTLDFVASDHSPCPPEMKALDSGDFTVAWGGIAGVQLLLPSTWTGLAARGGSVADAARLLSAAPARFAGLAARKGAIEPGHDADFVVWDPEATLVVHARDLHHRHPVTPWAGRELRGVVHQTWLRGRLVYDRELGIVDPPRGEFLAVHRRSNAAAH